MKVRTTSVEAGTAVTGSTDILVNLGRISLAGILPEEDYEKVVVGIANLLALPVGSVLFFELGDSAIKFSVERVPEETPYDTFSMQRVAEIEAASLN